MKQHITTQQAAELSIEQLKKLPFKLNEAQISEIKRLKEHGITAIYVSGKMTIGQMIEILESNESKENVYAIAIYQGHKECGICIDGKSFGAKELADALWEAVKGVL
jgi:hypothetical protein